VKLGQATRLSLGGTTVLRAVLNGRVVWVPPIPATTKAWISNAAGTKVHQAVTLAAPATAGTMAASDVAVNPAVSYQQMTAVGAAITESSAYLLRTYLSDAQRSALLTELFAPDQGGLGALRISIASQDFIYQTPVYTYDAGASDPEMTDFSIGTGTPGDPASTRDLRYIIPVLQEIVAINPDIRIVACPWSPPAWMKSGGTILGGGNVLLNATTGPAYARYFVKFIQAYRALGIPIYAVSVQNEPTYTNPIRPTCVWTGAQMATFVASYLGPALDAAGLSDVKIIVGDDNWSDTADLYPAALSPAAMPYVHAIAFHAYTGDPTEQLTVLDMLEGDQQIWFTEMRSLQSESLPTAMDLMCRTLGIDTVRNGASWITLWNLALDQSGNPTQGSPGRRGVLTVDTTNPGSVTRNPEYAMLRHLGQHLVPGAVRVKATSTLPAVAFRNPDGGIVTFLYNPTGGSSVSPKIINSATGKAVTVTLAPGEVATVVTSTAHNASEPLPQGMLPGGSIPPPPVAGFPGDITGLIGHFDGDSLGALGTTISSWPSAIGGGTAATQPTASLQPTVTAGPNGHKSAAFTNDVIPLPADIRTALSGVPGITAFVVAMDPAVNSGERDALFISTGAGITSTRYALQLRNTGNYYGLAYRRLDSDSVDTTYQSGTEPDSGAWFSLAAVADYANGANTLIVDGATIATESFTAGNASATVPVGANIGAQTNATTPLLPWRGSIAAVIIYNRALTADERSRVHAYLRDRYAIAISA